jgi:hypothetical protein
VDLIFNVLQVYAVNKEKIIPTSQAVNYEAARSHRFRYVAEPHLELLEKNSSFFEISDR